MSTPVRSHAHSNQELAAAFGRYMEARGFAAGTQKEYGDAVARYIESLRATSVADASRADARMFLGELCGRGLSATSIAKMTCGLRAFYKFLRFAGITHQSPMVTIPNRKLPRRVPRVLTVEEIERLIAAAGSPFERAVIEVLYATGVRVSELVNLRLENVDMGEHVILVKKGKGGKDRYVLFGQHAAKAIAEYLQWRQSKEFLFETPARNGSVCKMGGSWVARFYVGKVQHTISVSATSSPGCPVSRREVFVAAKKLRDGGGLTWLEIARHLDSEGFYKTPSVAADSIRIGVRGLTDRPPAKPRPMLTYAQARQEFDRIASQIPGFLPLSQRPYNARSIDLLVQRLGHRANLGRVHPHMLRRAMACHLLQNGANLRVVQELLGHERINSTQLYTYLSPDDLKKVHQRCHPHEKGK